MKLTVRDAATMMGVTPRTVRGRIQRGELPAQKEQGVWQIAHTDLPLTDRQRRSLARRADAVRRAVDEALPSRAATRRGDRRRSLADLDGFRAAAALWREVREAGEWAQLARELEIGLDRLAEGVHHYRQTTKLAALDAARAAFARAAGLILRSAAEPVDGPAGRWLDTLEGEVLPAVAGLARWTERQRPERATR